jgi:hypothetical protein
MQTNMGQVSKPVKSKTHTNITIPNTLLFLIHSLKYNIKLLYVTVHIWCQVPLRMSFQVQLTTLWSTEMGGSSPPLAITALLSSSLSSVSQNCDSSFSMTWRT